MRAWSRLGNVFDNAPVIPFNDASRIVVMSDMHRGDSSVSDEFAPNQNIFLQALNYYYENGFHLIENGDGDELWEHSRFSYIYYAHQDVFDLYRKFHIRQRLSIIYGNHNIQLKYPQKAREILWTARDPYTDQDVPFLKGIEPVEGIRLRYEELGKDIFIVHGHQGDAFNDVFWRVAHFMLRYVWRGLHLVGFRNPASPAKSRTKRHKIERMYERWIRENEQVMIVGHTHRPRFAEPESGLPYFNAGSAVRPQTITAIEITGGTISLVQWRIFPTERGLLQVRRRLLEGPVALSKYMLSRKA